MQEETSLSDALTAIVRREVRAEVDAVLPSGRFVSRGRLAEILGVSDRRIKTLRVHGMPARKIGRDLYFDVDEVNRFIDRGGRSA